MKQVIFKKLTLQNFLSIGADPVEIDFTTGLHIITGSNLDKPDRKNAIGKTTIVNGFYWSIFGNTIEGLKKDLIINNVVGGTAEAVLTFDVITSADSKSYKVVRRLNPSLLTLSCDGVDKTRDSIANTNELICEILSATPQLFQNCVVMTINNTIPFMAKSKTEKRKFIEDIFSLEVFSQMVQSVRSEYSELNKQYEVERSRFNEVNITLGKISQQRDNAIEQKKQKLNLYLKRQEENSVLLDSYNKELKDLIVTNIKELENKKVALESGNQKTTQQINQLIDEIATHKSNRNHETSILNNIGTDKDLCPKCLKPITSHDIEHIEKEKKEMVRKISKIDKEVEKLELKKVDTQDKKSKITLAIQQLNKKITDNHVNQQKEKNLKDKIAQILEWQNTLVGDIEECKDEKTDFDKTIDETLQRLKTFEDKCIEIKKGLNKLEVAKFILSDEGVKSYIVKILLDQLNSRLLYYLNKLDSNCICFFDEFFEEEILNERKRVCSYFNFSGAEKKAIDIACMFAFSDIKRTQGGVKYNVTFYDELFDTSFDEKGIELVVNVLKERVEKYNEGCYIVSHRKESVKNATGEIIYLIKENDITRRVDVPDGTYN